MPKRDRLNAEWFTEHESQIVETLSALNFLVFESKAKNWKQEAARHLRKLRDMTQETCE